MTDSSWKQKIERQLEISELKSINKTRISHHIASKQQVNDREDHELEDLALGLYPELTLQREMI